MLSSRGVILGRAVSRLIARQPVKSTNHQSIRLSHAANYREGPPPASFATRFGAEAVAGFMWWWILYHIFTEHEHITGEFEYPDPSAWTNAELGIPPDSEE
ncbi:NADH dehydrogenase [ubiquinone] 1 beta subcomplex subunit 2, mitochondrial-like [Episyrphus balteatus]|uniref:NADH dehydrogenase [ubiquinone] 1 beta subcomplex subunit 2, mitochondrial-like n=1 Tax=Episyrphus balteatus TaxID=286459 RepID=UPI0024863EB9|nr:NADH dehydrogenase [ubiquinone] 1 beta subcomplex subunit 2, mitochondrial-like [Episyrphus balteatus]